MAAGSAPAQPPTPTSSAAGAAQPAVAKAATALAKAVTAKAAAAMGMKPPLVVVSNGRNAAGQAVTQRVAGSKKGAALPLSFSADKDGFKFELNLEP